MFYRLSNSSTCPARPTRASAFLQNELEHPTENKELASPRGRQIQGASGQPPRKPASHQPKSGEERTRVVSWLGAATERLVATAGCGACSRSWPPRQKTTRPKSLTTSPRYRRRRIRACSAGLSISSRQSARPLSAQCVRSARRNRRKRIRRWAYAVSQLQIITPALPSRRQLPAPKLQRKGPKKQLPPAKPGAADRF